MSQREDYADNNLPLASPPALQIFGWLLIAWALFTILLLVFILATAVSRLLDTAGASLHSHARPILC